MDLNFGQQPVRLEDELRRMMLSGSSHQAVPAIADPTSRTTVRLPPYQSTYSDSSAASLVPNSHAYLQSLNASNGTQHLSQQRQHEASAPPHIRNQHQNRPPVTPPHQQGYGHSRRQQQQHAFRPPRASYQIPLDPNAFNRRGPPPAQSHLFNPNAYQAPYQPNFQQQHQAQSDYMDSVVATEVPLVEMSQAERDEKERFRVTLQKVVDEVCDSDRERLPKVTIECFGSFKSGFASAGSDMDLVIVLQDSSPASTCFSLFEHDLPRSLEKRMLQLGYGARLLTRTRVPIIKVCEKPGSTLLDKLRQERERWDFLDNDKKYPHLRRDEDEHAEDDLTHAAQASEPHIEVLDAEGLIEPTANGAAHDAKRKTNQTAAASTGDGMPSTGQTRSTAGGNSGASQGAKPQRRDDTWTRERKAGPLDFPKDGIGVQSDINFFNPLGLHNTQLLRCYSICDPRVRPMILLIKAFAKRRKINSSYSGTLSSYGYVLMVLHYLVNVARPPVLPNLQAPWRPNTSFTQQGADCTEVDGCVVDFWRREDEIASAQQRGLLTRNHESLGSLLVGFFHYFSSQGGGASFHWMQEVLSLRSNGGLMTKDAKGWVKAVTEEGDGKKVQHRYLFCIEDPFELDHNVARTVTHHGIVAIRDEFRRADRILRAAGQGMDPRDGSLFDELIETPSSASATTSSPGNSSYNQIDGAGDQKQLDQVKTQNQTARATNARRSQAAQAPPQKPKQLDLSDNNAFPSLGAATKPSKKKQGSARDRDVSEVSGERARAIVEAAKKKKAEEEASATATGAANAVLDGEN